MKDINPFEIEETDEYVSLMVSTLLAVVGGGAGALLVLAVTPFLLSL